MAYEHAGAGALDYGLCSYGNSRLHFRGPKAELKQPYVAVLGGSAVFGRFVPTPFPTHLSYRLGLPVLNLGLPNAGLDAFLGDEEVLSVVKGAAVVVIQILGAHNQSNRYYSVHPRRNDRFLGATPALRHLFPGVDFTEFAFNRHLLSGLWRADPDRFEIVAHDLRQVWHERMATLLAALHKPVLALHIRQPCYPARADAPSLRTEPLLISPAQVAKLRLDPEMMIEFTTGPTTLADLAEMRMSPIERPVAEWTPGPDFHREVASSLAERIARLI